MLLLRECMRRYNDKLQANALTNILLLRILQILAVGNLKSPETAIDSAKNACNMLLNLYSDSVFPHKNINESSEFTALKEQYAQYIKALEEGTIDRHINSSNGHE